jgi:uncharacterized Zn-binding protein involved in type VI secretion
MARQVIVVGDTLAPYGGAVTSGSSPDSVDGRAIARKGDSVNCVEHGVNRIAEGDESSVVNGSAVALERHHADCGCTLVSLQKTLSIG